MKSDHKELAQDLARSLDAANWMTWVEINLDAISLSPSRADVLAVAKSFANPRFVIYEIKTSRSDFLGDVNRGKYRAYFECCHQLYFACPTGLMTKAEIPSHCGLIVKGANGWHSVKSATRREYKPDFGLMMRLLLRGYEDQFEQWKQHERLQFLDYKGLKDASYRHGFAIGRDIADAAGVLEQARTLTKEIGDLLGIEYPSLTNAVYDLKRDVKNLMAHKRFTKEIGDLAGILMNMFDGYTFLNQSAPIRLRKIADTLESQLTEEQAEEAKRWSIR